MTLQIQDLQSELGRIKLSSSQIQRALSTKIQQLQAALSICIGGSARSTSNGSSNLNLGLLHQLHSPVAAFGDIGSVNNNDCSNNNEASASIVNLLLNSAAIGGIGGPGASGGESCSTDPNNLLWKFWCQWLHCTSGILSEPCPTTGSLFCVGLDLLTIWFCDNIFPYF